VIRPWSRVGVRVLSIGLLTVGLVGGVALGVDRQTQQRVSASGVAAGNDTDDIHDLKVRQADLWRATAGQRAAQVDAHAGASAAAGKAATKAKNSDDDARDQAANRSADRGSGQPPSSGGAGPVPTSCAQYHGNQATGCTLLLQRGFALSQMPCLVKIWNKESGWNEKAENPSSGAYGIPQALPASKMGKYGADYRTNPVPQIKWGLDYIKGRYGSPCGAWSYWQAHGWY
jgi:hypothetical protein